MAKEQGKSQGSVTRVAKGAIEKRGGYSGTQAKSDVRPPVRAPSGSVKSSSQPKDSTSK